MAIPDVDGGGGEGEVGAGDDQVQQGEDARKAETEPLFQG